MQRQRVLIAFGVAWLSALGLSWWLYRTSTAPQKADVVRIVAAAKDLPVGKRVEASDLKMISIERKDVPKGAFLKTTDIIDRAVAVQMSVSEPVLAGKIAGKGSGEGLTALIEPGMRAVSVQINEISGVAGFIQPGTRVDVMFTRVFSNGDAATATILQNVKVIAYGRQLDASAKLDPRDAKPTVATLLVTQEQAERLVLAEQRGKIQLALRNMLDGQIADASDPVQSTDLGIDEPRKGRAASGTVPRVAAPPPPPKPPEPVVKAAPRVEDDSIKVRIYRGDKVTEEAFK
jgi:pilus assembly protein CpaB